MEEQPANAEEDAEFIVELCDCPFGADHTSRPIRDCNGRPIRRGDHIVRGKLGSRHMHHGIYYGGANAASEVVHYARTEGFLSRGVNAPARDRPKAIKGNEALCCLSSQPDEGRPNHAQSSESNTPASSCGGGAAKFTSSSNDGATGIGGSKRWFAPVELRLESFQSFARGRPVCVIDSPVVGTTDLVLARARMKLGAHGHDIFHLQCEAFANSCRRGRIAEPATMLREAFASKVGVGYANEIFNHGDQEGFIGNCKRDSLRSLSVPSGWELRGSVPRDEYRENSQSQTFRAASAQATFLNAPQERATSGGRDDSLGTTDGDHPIGSTTVFQGGAPLHARICDFEDKAMPPAAAPLLAEDVDVQCIRSDDGDMVTDRRARLLALLRGRSLAFPSLSTAVDVVEEVLEFLRCGGYEGADYHRVRRNAQQKLDVALNAAADLPSMDSTDTGSHLVSWRCRLSKKVGDLLQVLFIVFDWQPEESKNISTVSHSPLRMLTGFSAFHGTGDSAAFKWDLSNTLHAFAQGLVFDVSPELSRDTHAATIADEAEETCRAGGTTGAVESLQALPSVARRNLKSPALDLSRVSANVVHSTPSRRRIHRGREGSSGERETRHRHCLLHLDSDAVDALMCMRLIIATMSLYLCWAPPPDAACEPPVPSVAQHGCDAGIDAVALKRAYACYACSLAQKLQAALRARGMRSEVISEPAASVASEATENARQRDLDIKAALDLEEYFESTRMTAGVDLVFNHAVCRVDNVRTK